MFELANEHDCPDCGESCFCSAGAVSAVHCSHDCEIEIEEATEPSEGELLSMIAESMCMAGYCY